MKDVIQNKGLVVAGLSGGSGKSVVTVGITAALTAQGILVSPFKKGPDYIDAGWLQVAAKYPCYNLDPFLMSNDTIRGSCWEHSRDRELIVVEGNRGLFDGVDVAGSYSTAELASILGLPVLLAIDCTKCTRTVAALVMGCQQMGKDINITGVVLNRIGSSRHERIIREAIEYYTDVEVIGAIPRLTYDVFPQRHIGITPCPEFEGASGAVFDLGELVRKYIDLERLLCLAQPYDKDVPGTVYSWGNPQSSTARVGVIKDAAFQFYYPENLRALELCGAELVEVNAMTDRELPELDGLYIGGGFPETGVKQLSANVTFRNSVKRAVECGLPVYAECGGLIYLGSVIEVDGEKYPLTSVFPVSFRMEKKPQAHGYTILTAGANNPVYPEGLEIKGHEFRYSQVVSWQGKPESLAFRMKRGTGFAEGRDGLVYKNTLALYTHIHALSTPEWAELFMAKVWECRGTPGCVPSGTGNG